MQSVLKLKHMSLLMVQLFPEEILMTMLTDIQNGISLQAENDMILIRDTQGIRMNQMILLLGDQEIVWMYAKNSNSIILRAKVLTVSLSNPFLEVLET